VGDLLGVTPATIDGWIRRGWLVAEELPQGETRVSEKHLVRFLCDRGVDLKEVMDRVARAEGADRPHRQGDAAASPAAEPSPDAARPLPAAPPPADESATACPPAGGAGQAGRAASAATPPAAEPAIAACGDPLDQMAARALDAILRDARDRGASEVYLEPQADGLALRLRLGGQLYEKPNFKQRLPEELRVRLLARLKAHTTADGTRVGWVLWPGAGAD